MTTFTNPAAQYGITDRVRFTIIKVNTNEIVARDLVVKESMVMVSLSAPSRCTFKIPQSEQYSSAAGIDWKTWGFWIIPEIEIGGVRKCLGAQLVNKLNIDQESGDLTVEGLGFMGYPKGIPWLVNFNPIAVDPAEVIQRVWAHLQDYSNAALGVEVLPATTGTQMLPGYGFDGSVLNFDFFAMFVRAVDFQDCGDVINSLARDIPLDLVEEVSWNTARTTVNKTVRIGYPYLGLQQQYLSFVLGENVVKVEKAEELDIEPVTDVIIRGWRPGKVYSSVLTNNDMTRVRRTIMEEDANIDSTERAAAWAKRRLTRRNIPKSFSKISVDPSHPNAPLSSFWVGDSIWVEAKNYPWVGDIAGWHRITSITFKENEPVVELGLRVEGAFNYDPITYDPNYEDEPTTDPNLLSNGYFSSNLSGWTRITGQWFRTTLEGRTNDGSVRVDCDDPSEILESNKVRVNPGGTYEVSAWVKRQSIVLRNDYSASTGGISLKYKLYNNGGQVQNYTRIAAVDNPAGVGPWTELKGNVTIPGGANEISVVLAVEQVSSGLTYWDDVRVIPL